MDMAQWDADLRHEPYGGAYERLMGAALVDPILRSALLHAPCATAVAFGLTQEEAAVVDGIVATDLQSFARALLPRLYPHRESWWRG